MTHIACELLAEHLACALFVCIEKRTSFILSCWIILTWKKAPAGAVQMNKNVRSMLCLFGLFGSIRDKAGCGLLRRDSSGYSHRFPEPFENKHDFSGIHDKAGWGLRGVFSDCPQGVQETPRAETSHQKACIVLGVYI